MGEAVATGDATLGAGRSVCLGRPPCPPPLVRCPGLCLPHRSRYCPLPHVFALTQRQLVDPASRESPRLMVILESVRELPGAEDFDYFAAARVPSARTMTSNDVISGEC